MRRRKTPLPFPDSGHLIKKYRKLRNYTIAELATHIEIDPKYLSTLESGHQMASTKVLFRLSIILNVDIKSLLIDDINFPTSNEYKSLIEKDLQTLSENELQLLYNFTHHVLPFTRHFKEY